jgi:hypothetical protein
VGGCRVSETTGLLGRSSNVEVIRKRRASLQKTYRLSLQRSREHLATSAVLSAPHRQAQTAPRLVSVRNVTRCVALSCGQYRWSLDAILQARSGWARSLRERTQG